MLHGNIVYRLLFLQKAIVGLFIASGLDMCVLARITPPRSRLLREQSIRGGETKRDCASSGCESEEHMRDAVSDAECPSD